jgi:predicted TIM-barrel fold metal-dependent hydrolase
MIDGRVVVDAHVHAPRMSTLRASWLEWADTFSKDHPWRAGYDANGNPDPVGLDGLFAAEGVDRALLFCEYSPRSTGVQPIEDNLPIVEHNPLRFALVANLNPHLHFPLVDELVRQVELGAVALKIHPVHGGFDPGDRELYPVYARCAELGVPVIIHSGTSSFPGSRTAMGNPELLLDAIDHFTDLNFVFAHGGRGWWYDVAAHMAQVKGNVWLDLAGLPPRKLPEYYSQFELNRLARKMIFGTDWPGVPGVRRNVLALSELGLSEDVLRDVLSGNAFTVFSRMQTPA